MFNLGYVCYPDTLYLSKQGCEGPSSLFEAKRDPRAKNFGEHCSSQYIPKVFYYDRQNKLVHYARILYIFLRKQPSTVTEKLPCQERAEHVTSTHIHAGKKLQTKMVIASGQGTM